MAKYFCSECNHETDERLCDLCSQKTETLDVDDMEVLEEQFRPYSYTRENNDLY